jgi:hypothetical protein
MKSTKKKQQLKKERIISFWLAKYLHTEQGENCKVSREELRS